MPIPIGLFGKDGGAGFGGGPLINGIEPIGGGRCGIPEGPLLEYPKEGGTGRAGGFDVV